MSSKQDITRTICKYPNACIPTCRDCGQYQEKDTKCNHNNQAMKNRYYDWLCSCRKCKDCGKIVFMCPQCKSIKKVVGDHKEKDTTCNNLQEIEQILNSKTFKIVERKNFDRIIITNAELEINWKIRGKIKDIRCKGFQDAIKRRSNTL